MFGIFKKRSEYDKLYAQYEKLLAESHRLSTVDRAASDEKAMEAYLISKKLDVMKP